MSSGSQAPHQGPHVSVLPVQAPAGGAGGQPDHAPDRRTAPQRRSDARQSRQGAPEGPAGATPFARARDGWGGRGGEEQYRSQVSRRSRRPWQESPLPWGSVSRDGGTSAGPSPGPQLLGGRFSRRIGRVGSGAGFDVLPRHRFAPACHRIRRGRLDGRTSSEPGAVHGPACESVVRGPADQPGPTAWTGTRTSVDVRR